MSKPKKIYKFKCVDCGSTRGKINGTSGRMKQYQCKDCNRFQTHKSKKRYKNLNAIEKCVDCGSNNLKRRGSHHGVQYYICKMCGRNQHLNSLKRVNIEGLETPKKSLNGDVFNKNVFKCVYCKMLFNSSTKENKMLFITWVYECEECLFKLSKDN